MENNHQPGQNGQEPAAPKENQYTPGETKFADGEGRPLEENIDKAATEEELSNAGRSAAE